MSRVLDECPPFCAVHVNGEHVGEMEGPPDAIIAKEDGQVYHVAAGLRGGPSGVYLETVVVKEGGEERRVRVPIQWPPRTADDELDTL